MVQYINANQKETRITFKNYLSKQFLLLSYFITKQRQKSNQETTETVRQFKTEIYNRDSQTATFEIRLNPEVFKTMKEMFN